jgi:hypothetical protein
MLFCTKNKKYNKISGTKSIHSAGVLISCTLVAQAIDAGIVCLPAPTPLLSHVVSSSVLANSRSGQNGPQGQRDDGGRKEDNYWPSQPVQIAQANSWTCWRPRSTIQTIIDRFGLRGSHQNQRRTGRPKVLSNQDSAVISRMIKKDAFISAPKVSVEMAQRGIKACPST